MQPENYNNGFSKVARYKINAQKFLAFLYTSDDRSERQVKETILLSSHQKRIKYQGINLPRQKNLYSEDCKILMKEIKYNTTRWREIYHVLGLE